jgi:hypothetical protein
MMKLISVFGVKPYSESILFENHTSVMKGTPSNIKSRDLAYKYGAGKS